MIRIEQLAHSVLNGTATTEDVKELARLALLNEDRIALLKEMFDSSFSDGRFIFEDWQSRAWSGDHKNTRGGFVSHRTPSDMGLGPVERAVYLPYGEFTKDVSCSSVENKQ